MNELLLRLALLIPWVAIVWIIAQGFDGDIDGWLTVALVIFFVPLAIVMNGVTMLVYKGRSAMKQFEAMREAASEPKKQSNKKVRAEAVNLADLPWYDPRKWTQ